MPAPLPTTTELSIGNEMAQLAILRDAMDRIGAEHGLAPRVLVELQVVLDEMVSNVIKYAWPEGGRHEVRVRISVDSARVVIEIADDGRTFNPLDEPPPEAPPPGQRPRPGGVGIHMLKQFMDNVEYSRIDGRNRLTLTKRRDVGAMGQ
jgi:anti-sigma regulatory factor (Ser/Thr protein kinase)